MNVLKALLRYYSYLFHLLLTLLLFAISGVAMYSGTAGLQLGMLPWTGATLVSVLFYSTLAGLVIILLAIFGKLRILFLLWALIVTVLAFKGYLFTGYRFAPNEFQTALYILGGLLLALPGAFMMGSSGKRRR